MTWSDALAKAESSLIEGNSQNAFCEGFGALEICYRVEARKHGWHSSGKGKSKFEYDKFMELANHLKQKQIISNDEFEIARYLASARNVCVHTYGFEFEPSLKTAEQLLVKIRQLCSKFGISVKDVMTRDVQSAKPDDPIGRFIGQMRKDGISQFPVLENGEVIGTLTEETVFRAWEAGEGILDPKMLVREIMDSTTLPPIEPTALLADVKRCLLTKPALLVWENRKLAGIVTKHDLLKQIEI